MLPTQQFLDYVHQPASKEKDLFSGHETINLESITHPAGHNVLIAN